jgi:outer membrane receptor protein involved in Fe transport
MRAAWTALLLACAATPALGVETVIVTARPPDPVGNGAFSVVTLDSSDLRVSNNLDKSLEQVPGLSLFRRDSSLSANPTTQGVSLRSIAPSGAGRALVTLDGVPQNDPFGGWVIWSALPPEDIASAEIVRGAGAGPYGAGALTGVIALTEQSGEGLAAADASYGSANTQHFAAAGGVRSERFAFFGSASYQSSDGWIPVAPDQRGAADDDVTLVARNASLGVSASPDGATTFVLRGSGYEEHRNSGVVGTQSADSGKTASLTIVHPEEGDALGWRLQAWVRDTDFSNSSASIAVGRNTATPSNDQYATPALGWGANAELRGETSWLKWAIGGDARRNSGESREHFSFVGGQFTMNRVSGGDGFVGGGYAEGAARFDNWLLTLGVRADEWTSTGGHLVQNVIKTGQVTVNQHFAPRGGVVPTARGGVRYDFGDLYLRSAAYEGFRAPSLNELYRPFRLGNNFTLANPALAPEKLYGAEIGAGATFGALSFDMTGFWNQLHAAITNVTVGHGPGIFPVAGFLPAGGLLILRQNAGDIDAWGLEAESHYRFADDLHMNAAFDYVDATVHAGAQAPQLTGKRPAQAPRWTVTGSVDAEPIERLTLYADIRYESNRFSDDQNTLPLGDATTVDARISWLLAPQWSAYVAADNIFNQRIATSASTDALGRIIFTNAAPAEIRAGLSFAR